MSRDDIAACLVSLVLTVATIVFVLGCPDSPSPSWSEQHHAGAR